MRLVRRKAPGELWRQWDPKRDDCMDRGIETMDVEPVEADAKYPPKSRTVEVAEFATWWQDSPDAVRVEVMSQSKVDHFVEAKKARRIGEWREIEIFEES
jgi:hypothetical protein